MNFGSDQRVRDAFRATLQGEPSSANLVGTQEIDAADVLEVTDLANAIARAEEVIRARSSRVLMSGPDSSASADEPRGEDIFDRLVAGENGAARTKKAVAVGEDVATDDAVGPAVHAPSLPTPLPPRTSAIPLPPGIARPATLLRAPEEVFATPIPLTPPTTAPSTIVPPPAPLPALADATQPLAPLNVPPATRTAPILILDEDAFYHPAGRIRTLADVTLETYRPEPTLMVRLRERRHVLKWIVAAIVVPLALFAIFAVAVGLGRAKAERAQPSTAATNEPVLTATTAKAAAAPTTPAVTAAATPSPAPSATDVPVFDVKSLKSAPPLERR